jgi:DNA-binding IclR family transcriptional regulator
MIKVLGKAISLVDIISTDPKKEWSIEELSREINMPISTVHRILLSLKHHEILEQSKVTKKFRLGLKLLNWGFIYHKNMDLRLIALPVMEALTEKTQETSFLSMLHNSEGMIIEKVEGSHPIRFLREVGTKFPLLKGASAKVLLSNMDQEERNLVYDNLSVSPTLISQAEEECEEIREQGYSVTFNDRHVGVVSIAAPVQDFYGKKDKVICIAGPQERFTEEKLPDLVNMVRQAAEDITRKMIGT